ncbi:hypothetical protein BDV06DRAFT_207148 [Aspergillus oleicola]
MSWLLLLEGQMCTRWFGVVHLSVSHPALELSARCVPTPVEVGVALTFPRSQIWSCVPKHIPLTFLLIQQDVQPASTIFLSHIPLQ